MAIILCNKPLRELSILLYDCPVDPTPGAEFFDGRWLDFSIESLEHIEDYLDYIRPGGYKGPQELSIVLRAGAYVGEVIRRHAKSKQ